MAIVVGVLVAILGGYGVWLTYLGASTAASTMRFFGQELSTTSVGVACVFIAGVLGVIILRRVLR